MTYLDVPYELIAPDGTRAVLGNSVAAMSDTDWIGPLDPDANIQGLLDRAGIRESSSDLVEGDGATHGPFWLSRRAGTIQGILLPTVLDMGQVAAAESKLKRATRALRADGLLRWIPPNASSPRQLRIRVQDGPRVTGRRPKAFQVTLVSADPYALSSTENSATISAALQSDGEITGADPFTDPIGVASTVGHGIPNPIPEPILSNEVASNQTLVAITNAGDAPTWPRFRITGPVTDPTLLNNTTGESWSLSYTLAAGEFLDVYPQLGRILAGGTADRYSSLDFLTSTWWQLEPGANDVRLLASTYSAGAEFTIYWRDAYE